MLTVCLITLGDPATLTGGYRYHRRMAELAARHDARLTFASLPLRRPYRHARRVLQAARQADVVLVDSLVAAYLAPWIPPRRRPDRQPDRRPDRRPDRQPRLAAIVHQPPGGIDQPAPRQAVQARLDRYLYRRCDLVILASSRVAGLCQREVVIPPGRDQQAATQTTDLRHNARAAALCVANWLPAKGILDLLDAVADLPAGTLRLHLAGDERADTQYGQQVLARLAGPAGHGVVRHGRCDDAEMGRLYRSADLFVLPSRWETFGTAFAEAMDAGLPVIGWRTGNVPYLVDDGIEGIVLPPGDVTALTGALRRLADHEPERRRMGAAAARRVQRLPTWEESAKEFFTVLGKLL